MVSPRHLFVEEGWGGLRSMIPLEKPEICYGAC